MNPQKPKTSETNENKNAALDEATLDILKDPTNQTSLITIRDSLNKKKVQLRPLAKNIQHALEEVHKDRYKSWSAQDKEQLLTLPTIGQNHQMAQTWSRAVLQALKDLFIQLNYTPDKEFLVIASKKWQPLDTSLLSYYFEVFECKDLIPESDILDSIHKSITFQKLGDVVKLIKFFGVHKHYDIPDLLAKLVNQDKVDDAEVFARDDKNYTTKLVELMSSNTKHLGKAAELIQKNNLDPNLFPVLIRALEEKHVHGFLESSSLDRIEDHFLSNKKLLGYALEALVQRQTDKMNTVASMAKRHNLLKEGHITNKEVGQVIEEILSKADFQERANPLFALDAYEPTEELVNQNMHKKGSHISWTDHKLEIGKNVFLVDDPTSPVWAIATTELLGAKIVGLDTEFIGNYHRLDPAGGVSIFQMSTPENTYIFDVIKLNTSPAFTEFIHKFFMSESVIKVAHTFSADQEEIRKNIDCENVKLKNLVDVVKVYQKITGERNMSSLTKMAQDLLGKPISKAEQKSRWTNRPLRKAQIHYAALDSYLLLPIYEILSQKAKERNIDMSSFIEEITFKDEEPDVQQSSSEEEGDGVTKETMKKSPKKEPAEEEEKKAKVKAPPKPKKEEIEREGTVRDGTNGLFYSHPKYKHFYEGKSDVKFVFDSMMQKVVKFMRNVGLDAEYVATNDNSILDVAHDEQRIIVTRKRQLFDNRRGLPTYLFENSDPEEQYLALVDFFKVKVEPGKILSRCVKCNGNELEVLDYETANKDLKWSENTLNTNEFWRCIKCKQMYWEGSSYKNARERFSKLTQTQQCLKIQEDSADKGDKAERTQETSQKEDKEDK